jgi:hypothetical protein
MPAILDISMTDSFKELTNNMPKYHLLMEVLPPISDETFKNLWNYYCGEVLHVNPKGHQDTDNALTGSGVSPASSALHPC